MQPLAAVWQDKMRMGKTGQGRKNGDGEAVKGIQWLQYTLDPILVSTDPFSSLSYTRDFAGSGPSKPIEEQEAYRYDTRFKSSEGSQSASHPNIVWLPPIPVHYGLS